MSRTYTQREYEALERKMKKGWAMFYQLLDRMSEMTSTIYRENSVSTSRLVQVSRSEFPTHISDEYFDMCVSLHKDLSCVICMDLIEKGNYKMTWCGHLYCKEDYDEIKTRFNECSICKKKL